MATILAGAILRRFPGLPGRGPWMRNFDRGRLGGGNGRCGCHWKAFQVTQLGSRVSRVVLSRLQLQFAPQCRRVGKPRKRSSVPSVSVGRALWELDPILFSPLRRNFFLALVNFVYSSLESIFSVGGLGRITVSHFHSALLTPHTQLTPKNPNSFGCDTQQ